MHGLPTYVVGARTPGSGLVVIIPDMYGYAQPSVRLLADRLAAETGAGVYVPDFFGGDALPLSHLAELSESGEVSYFEKMQAPRARPPPPRLR